MPPETSYGVFEAARHLNFFLGEVSGVKGFFETKYGARPSQSSLHRHAITYLFLQDRLNRKARRPAIRFFLFQSLDWGQQGVKLVAPPPELFRALHTFFTGIRVREAFLYSY